MAIEILRSRSSLHSLKDDVSLAIPIVVSDEGTISGAYCT